MQYIINTFSFHRREVFFHKCLLCVRVLFYGFMPKIIFFYAEKLGAILVWFFFSLSQMLYRTFIGHPRNRSFGFQIPFTYCKKL